jgi:hypothetical protein
MRIRGRILPVVIPPATRACFVILIGLGSCASPLADYSGYVAPRPYAIDCGAGWQYAATALKANGFVIGEVRRQATGGVVVGKRGDETMAMAVSCEGDGVHVTPSGLTPYARNGMLIAFERVMQSASAVHPPQGMEVSAELVTSAETGIYFSHALDPSSVAARFRIGNGGERPVRLLTRNITVHAASGSPVSALDTRELQQRAPGLATEIAPRLLPSTVLESGSRAEGFLVFPAGVYEGATIRLIDVETEEAEEFEVAFR